MTQVTQESDRLTSDDTEIDASRRGLALALLGAVGGSALLKGCASPDLPEGDGIPTATLSEATQSLVTTLNIRRVGTMTELRATTGSSEYIAILGGFYAAGDGGGGVFVWSSTSKLDDGGTVINPAGGTAAGWRRIYDGPLNVRWFGAKGDDVANDAPAIQAAINAAIAGASHVFLPTPLVRYRINSTLTLNGTIEVRGAGYRTEIHATSGYAFTIDNPPAATFSPAIRDLRITCDPGVGGIRQVARHPWIYVIYALVERVHIDLAASGSAIGIRMETDNGATAINWFNIFRDVTVHGNFNSANKGLVQTGTTNNCVGARMYNGRFTAMGTGIDLSNMDTWLIDGTAIDGIIGSYPSGAPSTSGTGRGIALTGSACHIRDVRFEDNDVDLEIRASSIANRVDLLNEFAPGKIIDNGGRTTMHLYRNATTSKVSAATVYHDRLIAGRMMEYFVSEVCTVVNGANQRISDNSSVVQSISHLVGATGAFSVGSIRINPSNDPLMPNRGMVKWLYNSTSQAMTIKNLDAAAPNATERIKTLTGSDVTVSGPGVAKFFYDGLIDNCWIYMGSS